MRISRSSRSAELLLALLLVAAARAEPLKVGDAIVRVEPLGPAGREGRVVVERGGKPVWSSRTWLRPVLERAPGGFRAGGEVIETEVKGTVQVLALHAIGADGVTTGEVEVIPGPAAEDRLEAALLDEREGRLSSALDRLEHLGFNNARADLRALARLSRIHCKARLDGAFDAASELEKLAREMPQTPAGQLAADEARRRRAAARMR